MKSTVYKSDFRDAFTRMNRAYNFSYEGLGALYEYLTEYEEGSGEEMELDVIAICCDFTEYTLEDYEALYVKEEETFETIEDAIADAEQNTAVIRVNENSFIIQNY